MSDQMRNRLGSSSAMASRARRQSIFSSLAIHEAQQVAACILGIRTASGNSPEPNRSVALHTPTRCDGASFSARLAPSASFSASASLQVNEPRLGSVAPVQEKERGLQVLGEGDRRAERGKPLNRPGSISVRTFHP